MDYSKDVMTEHYTHLARTALKAYSFREDQPLAPQQAALREKYAELLRIPQPFIAPPRIEYTGTDHSDYDEIRFHIESEPGFFLPAHLLLPKKRKAGQKLPVVICLQGHSTGMHISLGRAKFPGDQEFIDRKKEDFALQCIRRGYAAVAMEQRAFGELKTKIPEVRVCQQVAMQALLVGRTLLGERVYDISRLVDALSHFPELDMQRISMMGQSGGGTAAYHAAALEPRIRAVLTSCAFNRYDRSILPIYHCCCNYVPGFLENFEMCDLAMLIAPRPLLVVCGRDDDIFPLEGVQDAFETVRKIYRAAGDSHACRMVVGQGGHRFYPEEAWPIFETMI